MGRVQKVAWGILLPPKEGLGEGARPLPEENEYVA